ncbi:MAG: hypothetical protein HONBIEJF_01156 [Fimbriimonadaceae bacterium]|nr:hypothetical protein [Fimbriimonadaceae bacterium]
MKDTFRIWFRFLTFRGSREDLLNPTQTTIALGLVGVVLAGIGRWWDDPNVSMLQQTGLGSVAYVLFLALLLLSLTTPFWPQARYRVVLAMVCLTSLPALLYAVPVERFLAEDHATIANATALGVVAAYRVALLVWFLARVPMLRWYQNALVVLSTISFIGSGVFILGYAPHILATMGGMRHTNPLREQASKLGEDLACISVLAIPVVVVVYGIVIAASRKPKLPEG